MTIEIIHINTFKYFMKKILMNKHAIEVTNIRKHFFEFHLFFNYSYLILVIVSMLILLFPSNATTKAS